ncbi:hypothetical protein AALO_G00146260 [Alosa alosa]|uniref:Uncharacterized protein n=1 Tax=Alosa alosa TaxID=278164 RepID=A0AAV6GPM7_9TELE|nr:hypothetical protein AALO_G00146260 [Alosa alosa]
MSVRCCYLQRVLRSVQKGALWGDAQSVLSTIDRFSHHHEWAMHTGDEKAVRLVPPDGRLITLQFNHYTAVAWQVIEWAGLQNTECALLRKGTVVLADNVICPGAPEYLEYVRTSPAYLSSFIPAHLEYTQAENALEKRVLPQLTTRGPHVLQSEVPPFPLML